MTDGGRGAGLWAKARRLLGRLPSWQWRGFTKDGVQRFVGSVDAPPVVAHRILFGLSAVEAAAALGMLAVWLATGAGDPIAAGGFAVGAAAHGL